MIDLHTHVLPNVDDGARTLDEALALCRRAADDGASALVATPHSGGREGRPHGARPSGDEVTNWVTALQHELDDNGVSLRLLPGMEIYVEGDLLEHPERLVTLGASRALLLELPFDAVPMGFDDLLFQLQVKGYTPIIAHPERNHAIAAKPALLYAWVNRGALAQVTAMSLIGGAGAGTQRAAEQLVAADLVHVIASDAHWVPERPTGLSDAVARVAQLKGQERATAMVSTVPEAILANRPVRGFSPSLPQPPRPWWRFW